MRMSVALHYQQNRLVEFEKEIYSSEQFKPFDKTNMVYALQSLGGKICSIFPFTCFSLVKMQRKLSAGSMIYSMTGKEC